MKEFFKKRNKKLDNSGIALITVIVVIGFVSILATIILYVTGKNYYMKTTDTKIKASFYTAETALEMIKADLLSMSNDAFCEAYKDTMINYTAVANGSDRETNYFNAFVDAFEADFNSRLDMTQTKPIEAYFKSVVGAGYEAGLTVDCTALDITAASGYLIIEDFTLVYTSSEGYDTIIKTDFLVRAPEVNWYASQSRSAFPPGADTAAELSREKHDIAETVIYYNWEKW
ncbi:MAG: hypothetical protein IKL04_09260 [Lachnospiraceae bacterium]|nr:hypothetical protein [Lachnospiraceae bacterium]